jgi:NAD+ diphosphatase
METEPAPRRGVIAVIVRDERFLVIRRSQHVVAPRAFCFPGGAIEGSESEPQALVRELREELGVEVTPRERLWASVTPWRVELAWWSTELDLAQSVLPNPAEVESAHWFTAAEMRALPELLTSNRDFLDAHERGDFRLG